MTREWPYRVVVPVTTLDALIDEYGESCFIKIDVEGYEAHVLAGLSRPVQALVFEFQHALPDVREGCLRRLRESGSYEIHVDNPDGKRATSSPRLHRALAGALNSQRHRELVTCGR
jgi:hypothetical protein